jgi:eukaryotic-like serine/threonine-protein kinase
MPEVTPQPEESGWGFAEGDVIAPGFTAIKLLGGGFRYEAYLSWDDHLRALVVLKVVRPGLVDDDRTLEGLAGEIEMLERLSHPVLVRSFGHDLDGPRPFVSLEHLEGPRLSTLLRRYGPLTVEQTVPLALQLSSAAHYMNEEGVAHLDIKPSNIIMGGPPRLIDLSVAKTHAECEDLSSAIGTDAYMAPEQCLPMGPVKPGPASDVWGIGATLFRAVAGSRAFPEGERDAETDEERWPQLELRPEPLPDHVGPAVAEPIMECLAYSPAERPTLADLADRLEPVLGALPKPRLSKLKPRVQR